MHGTLPILCERHSLAMVSALFPMACLLHAMETAIDDASAGGFQQFVRQVRPTSGHEVDGFHGTQGNNPGVTTAIADNANRFHWLEHHECLADLVGTSPTLKAHLANNAATCLDDGQATCRSSAPILLAKQLVTVEILSNLTNRENLT